jgi:ABC-type iron transport system FetAB ATPase subunit
LPTLTLNALQVGDAPPANLEVPAGECVALSGPSGSGKTRLLRAIADLDPHAGDAALDGDPASAMRPSAWRTLVGYLPAESHWWGSTVGEHFATIDPAGLSRLGLDPGVMGWEVRRLSSGERQRLALLRLLWRGPRALLLDEPTANLDETNRDAVEGLIAEYRAATRAPVVWVSHDPAQRRRVASRALRIAAGQLHEGTVT